MYFILSLNKHVQYSPKMKPKPNIYSKINILVISLITNYTIKGNTEKV